MAATVSPLSPSHLEALRTLLGGEPVQNLYLLGLLEDFGLSGQPGPHGFSFFGRFEGPRLTAALFVGGRGALVVPSASPASCIQELAEALKPDLHLRACLGEQSAVNELLRHLRADRPRLSLVQRLWSVSADDLGPFTNPTLRLATADDLPSVLPLAEGYVRECLHRDPGKEDAEGFRARVALRIRLQRTYVLPEPSGLLFKVDVGSRSKFGAELEGVYTRPDERRKKHAILSLGQISRHLLSSLPRLTLRINEDDQALSHIARRVGYVQSGPQRMVLFD